MFVFLVKSKMRCWALKVKLKRQLVRFFLLGTKNHRFMADGF